MSLVLNKDALWRISIATTIPRLVHQLQQVLQVQLVPQAPVEQQEDHLLLLTHRLLLHSQ